MTKYIVTDRNGNELKINARITDYKGRWWYYKGITNSIGIAATLYEEQSKSEAKVFKPSQLNIIVEAKQVPDYNLMTSQGYKIVQKWGYDSVIHVIYKRELKSGYKDYCIGLYYDLETGTWAQGKYDFPTIQQAQKTLLRFMYDSYVIE